MKTIFLVSQCEFDYGGGESTPIFSTFERAKAEAKVTEQEQIKASVIVCREAIYIHMATYDITNPRPHAIPTFTPLPSFNGKKSTWTASQKAIYDRAFADNKNSGEFAAKIMRDWVNARYAEQLRFTATLPQVVQDNLLYMSDRTSFEINEVPFVE